MIPYHLIQFHPGGLGRTVIGLCLGEQDGKHNSQYMAACPSNNGSGGSSKSLPAYSFMHGDYNTMVKVNYN